MAPQGILFAAPALMGFAVLIFQATALTLTIAIPELLTRAYRIGAGTYLDVLILTGLLYLAVTIPFGSCRSTMVRQTILFERRFRGRRIRAEARTSV